MKKSIFLVVILLFQNSTFCQTPTWKIYNTSNSNIPWNKFKAMDFDEVGNLWGCYDNSGTVPHLTKFDGDTFINFMTTAWVNDIISDNDGDMWLTTSNMELQKYNGNFTIYTNALLNSPWLEPIFVDPAFNVWIVNNNNSYLIKFNGSNWVKYDHTNSCLPASSILCLNFFKNDLWLGTADSGLVKFGNIQCMVYKTTNSPLPSNRILALQKGVGDTLWFVCPGNLGYFDGTNWKMYANANLISANSIQFDSKGCIWISNPDFTKGGIFKFDRTNWTIYSKSNSPIPTNQILDMKVDDEDNVWIATWGSGLVKMSPYTSSIIDYKSVNISVYPNPASDNLLVSLPVTDNYKAEIVSLSGQINISSQIFNQSNFTLDVSNLEEGCYILKIQSQTINYCYKIIKQ